MLRINLVPAISGKVVCHMILEKVNISCIIIQLLTMKTIFKDTIYRGLNNLNEQTN